jgi:mono/diheme cytochrome c family protein
MRFFASLSTMCAVALGTALVAAAPQAQTEDMSRTDYQAFCSSCHGATGQGDGPLAASMRTKPADLTQVKTKNDGVFPKDRIMKLVTDGHESAGMPAWGQVFAKSQQSVGPDAARLRVEALVQYLETLQAKR